MIIAAMVAFLPVTFSVSISRAATNVSRRWTPLSVSRTALRTERSTTTVEVILH
jgi:hypothetical protein